MSTRGDPAGPDPGALGSVLLLVAFALLIAAAIASPLWLSGVGL